MRFCKFFIHNHGNVAIEFALILPFIFLFLSAVINFGLILGNQNRLNSVVSAGILYAFGNSSTPATIQTIMQTTTNLNPLTVTATRVCKCYPSSGAPSGTLTANACTSSCSGTLGAYITVTVQSQVNLIGLNLILPNPFVTRAQGTVRTS
jgi:Flp pilus assembly protein TadG